LLSGLERETGIEPATFSLGNRPSIANKEHRVSGHLVLAIEITENLMFAPPRFRMEHKWSTQFVCSPAFAVAACATYNQIPRTLELPCSLQGRQPSWAAELKDGSSTLAAATKRLTSKEGENDQVWLMMGNPTVES